MIRSTSQRRAIRRVFEESGRPLSPLEILEAARDEVPRIGIATVYRTVKGLLEDGWLAAVQVPGEAPRYEIAGKPHHHHFHCRSCGAVFDVQGCSPAIKSLSPRGYQTEGHDLVFFGRCPSCKRR
ncbi:MAG: transcriptional repressor [Phycisphaerae bacterium]|jgi:Fur family ferric uptake transcriptional regulator|nr:transcriptional repressor [Phycisphaerae bacterium]MCZ2400298.1 transcriptional repressor [Phycisphaerae bacterium]NUQ50081.1 transcriptional repressor [Phycisphaerae bacterium]